MTTIETCKCPKCGTTLDEEEDLVHDGYMGSPYAHNGRGSYGLGRHHYYYVCHCGWSERPDITARKRREARRQNRSASYTWNGVILPAGCGEKGEDYKVLVCDSRWTKTDTLANLLARRAKRIGRGVGHSLCASYIYTIVPASLYREAEKLIATGQFKKVGNYEWHLEPVLNRLGYEEFDPCI